MTESDRPGAHSSARAETGILASLLRGLIPGTLLGLLLFVIYIAMAALAGH